MRILYVRLFACLILLISVFAAADGFAQHHLDTPQTPIAQLEREITNQSQLVNTQQKLNVLKQQAFRAGDEILFARSLANLLRIRDHLTEDSAYFRNSAFIDTLLYSKTSSLKLKSILYVMRAKRISAFDGRRLKFNAATYRTKDLKADYGSLNRRQRTALVNNDLDSAMHYQQLFPDGNPLLWLSSNPDLFLFKPSFGDIILAEKVNLLATKGQLNEKDAIAARKWLGLSSAQFMSQLAAYSKDKQNGNIFAAYHNWLTYHKATPSIAAFVESLVRKLIYLPHQADTVLRQKYVDYLQDGVASEYAHLKAHSVYQLCLIWNEDGNKYTTIGNSYRYQPTPAFNPKYQFFPVKALQLYERNQALMCQYPLFDKILSAMATQIKAKGLSIEIENRHLPREEIPVRLVYKNAKAIFYRILKTNQTEIEFQKNGKVSATRDLLAFQPVAEGSFELPLPLDHNQHATLLKLPALPVGDYRLLFSQQPISIEGNELNNIHFEVTQIAAVNSEKRLFVLDRKTGFPLVGAKIKTRYKNKPLKKGEDRVVGRNGDVTVDDTDVDWIEITHQGDTLLYAFNVNENELRDEIFDPEEYDDLNEFYDDQLQVSIFTDRSIYRPGQTVHYKLIFLTRDAKTGSPILFNKGNVGSMFNNRLNKWLEDGNDEIYLTDPFSKKIDTAVLKMNEFGSFSGEFTIPKTAATGLWQIEGMPDSDDRNYGEFRIEEYKRPTIELSAEKQKKILKIGEPFTVKLKLRSFSGADLGNIPISYTINRSGNLPPTKNEWGDFDRVQLSKKTGYTNAKGELEVPVADTLIAKVSLTESIAWNYTYEINAQAVDVTGESTDLKERINISSRYLKINMPVLPIYDIQKFPPLHVTTVADFEGTVVRKVNVKLYRVANGDEANQSSPEVDQWYYRQSDWNKWFPDQAVLPKTKQVNVLVLDTLIDTERFEKLTFGKGRFPVGFYEIEATVKENEHIVGQSKYNFRLFESQSVTPPTVAVNYMPFNSAKPGEVITWYTSGKKERFVIYHLLYIDGQTKRTIKQVYQTYNQKNAVQEWRYQIPANATEQLVISRICISDNKLERQQQTIFINQALREPLNIVVEKYRKVMAPGAKETFTVSIKTKDNNIAAELMTTLYDASLDKLNEHRWQVPNTAPPNIYLNANWGNFLTSTIKTGDNTEPNKINLSALLSDNESGTELSYALSGKVPGVSVSDASGLNEVVVTGYGRRESYSTSSVVTIRGTTTLQDYNQPLVIIDGKIFTDDLKKLRPESIVEAMVLKGADASSLYGARAAAGVLILSTKGPIVLPEAEVPVVKVRKKFQETAFFYPQIHMDQDGYYRFSFTMPETTTEWNWKMFAHTRKAKFAYLEKKLQTQLNLMVQPSMPRLLYQNDQINLKSRVSNLDTLAIKGKATCKIEDAVTGDDLTALFSANATADFKLDRNSTGSVSFLLRVPAGQLNPVKIVIAVNNGSIGDAEEHVIPISSTKVLIRQSQPLQLNEQATAIVPTANFPADATLYGVSLSIAQKPQAAVIYALPWLANYAYDCAEQTFNKLRARVTALRLMQKDTTAQRAFQQAQDFNANNQPKTELLPDELAEVTMPWLGIGNRAAKQQQQLFNLLDTLKTKIAIDQHLERLSKLQLADGGLTWFEGGMSNAYISSYVLAGFGQLKQTGWPNDPIQKGKQQKLIDNLVKYHENAQFRFNSDPYANLLQLYAVAYWIKSYTLSPQYLEKVNALLNAAWAQVQNKDLEAQALLIISTLKYTVVNSQLHNKAKQQLENISQLAIRDANGIRWKAISDSETLNNTAEETMSLLAEAFELSGQYPAIQSGIAQWLLAAKQQEHWQTTKATAAAIALIQKEKGSTFAEPKTLSAKLGGHDLSVSDALLGSSPVQFVPIKKRPENFTIKQAGTATTGAMSWYYFALPVNLDTLNKSLKMNKTLYVFGGNNEWQLVQAGQILKAGDRIQVKLTIETNAVLKFAHINDPRAAAFEPKGTNSGNRYSDGLSYYQSIRDTGLDIFAELIPRGISTISYELVVAHEGEFANGAAKIQCLYQPAVTAYSSGISKVKTN